MTRNSRTAQTFITRRRSHSSRSITSVNLVSFILPYSKTPCIVISYSLPVNRDGQFVPDQYSVNNRGDIYTIGDAVFYAAMAWSMTGDGVHAANIAHWIDTWFINNATAQTPNSTCTCVFIITSVLGAPLTPRMTSLRIVMIDVLHSEFRPTRARRWRECRCPYWPT